MKKITIAAAVMMIAAVMPVRRLCAEDFTKELQNCGDIKQEVPAPEAEETRANILPEVFYKAMFASKGKAISAEKNIYNTLAAIFAKAGPVTEKDLTGFFTGRGFYEDKPNKPVASLFAGQRFEIPANPQTGPLFEARHSKFKFAGFFNFIVKVEPDYCDGKLADYEFIGWVKQNISGPAESYQINDKEAAGRWVNIMTNHSGVVKSTITHQVRKYDKYLILKMITIDYDGAVYRAYAYYWPAPWFKRILK